MSTAATPGQSSQIGPYQNPGHAANLAAASVGSLARRITRRPNYAQGRALEVLGHAIEYLVDSRLILVNEPSTRADFEATQMLMLHSRHIFAECAEVLAPGRRLKLWIAERFGGPASC